MYLSTLSSKRCAVGNISGETCSRLMILNAYGVLLVGVKFGVFVFSCFSGVSGSGFLVLVDVVVGVGACARAESSVFSSSGMFTSTESSKNALVAASASFSSVLCVEIYECRVSNRMRWLCIYMMLSHCVGVPCMVGLMGIFQIG